MHLFRPPFRSSKPLRGHGRRSGPRTFPSHCTDLHEPMASSEVRDIGEPFRTWLRVVRPQAKPAEGGVCRLLIRRILYHGSLTAYSWIYDVPLTAARLANQLSTSSTRYAVCTRSVRLKRQTRAATIWLMKRNSAQPRGSRMVCLIGQRQEKRKRWVTRSE